MKRKDEYKQIVVCAMAKKEEKNAININKKKIKNYYEVHFFIRNHFTYLLT